MKSNILLDTSVIIEEIRCGSRLFQELCLKMSKNQLKIYLPTLVITELWSGKSMAKQENIKKMTRLLEPFLRIDFNEPIAKIAGQIIRKNQASGFDALVGAHALYLDASLATLNSKHFQKITYLKLFSSENKASPR